MPNDAAPVADGQIGSRNSLALKYAWIYALILLIGGRLLLSPEIGLQFILGQTVGGLILGAIVAPAIWLVATLAFKQRWRWHSWLNSICYLALALQLFNSVGGPMIRQAVTERLERARGAPIEPVVAPPAAGPTETFTPTTPIATGPATLPVPESPTARAVAHASVPAPAAPPAQESAPAAPQDLALQRDPAAAKRVSDNFARMAHLLKVVNADLPKMLDGATRLDAIEFGTSPEGSIEAFYYRHTLLKEYSPTAFAELSPFIVQTICSDSDMLGYGVPLVYVYRSNSGVEVGRVAVTASECSAIK